MNGAVLKLNFRHAALTYLEEYFWLDSRLSGLLSKALQNHDESIANRTAGSAVIGEFLQRYSVARNFKRVEEEIRYQAILTALRKIVEMPITDDEVATVVTAICAELKCTYGNEPLSATTKLLWLRFRHPVVIYDKLSWNWLRKNSALRDAGGYVQFLEEWRKAFVDAEPLIIDACNDLPKVREFTCVPGLTQEKMIELTSQLWFQERVFDHAMVNVEYEREIAASLCDHVQAIPSA